MIGSNADASLELELGDSERDRLISQFVRTNSKYYIHQFKKIGSNASFVFTWNTWAALLGPIWFSARGLWYWGLAFLMVETFAWVQIVRGQFGDIAAEAWERMARIEATLALRQKQLAAAIEKGSEKVVIYQRVVESLERDIGGIRLEAERIEASGITVALMGVVLLVMIKLIQAMAANSLLERRYSAWLSDAAVPHGLPMVKALLSALFTGVVVVATALHYSFPGEYVMLAHFPTDPEVRLVVIAWVEGFFSFSVNHGEVFFDFITVGIRTLLDGLERLFVTTPWMVTGSVIILLTGLSTGVRTAIYAAAFLAYMGLLGFWEKAMITLALLGTAACLSILIGIPLGMFCARRPRFYAMIRPIMDFMQTMPAFVFMIPVIAFFGTGKPAAVVTTMIFGGTPVVRLTVLGLQGVPDQVREAAISFGANKWYLLTKVDLPLAGPSIRAGINQTIMLSLAMVVVASLIGAKGLGEDVLEALQYANVGQGILAGFAILFCAMMLDRIVQGAKR